MRTRSAPCAHAQVMGMQIRKGDSCAVRNSCVEDNKYLEAATRMKEKYGADVILLATDSPTSVRTLRPPRTM